MQVSLSLVLLAGAFLFVRSLQKLLDVQPGFRPEGIVSVSVDLRPAHYSKERLPVIYREPDLKVTALHTPGHTEGSTCFHFENERVLFSGDVIFQGSTGRWDLPGGDREQMERSLERLMTLPPATMVYPGHGATTTLGAEVRTLRVMREAGVLPGLKV